VNFKIVIFIENLISGRFSLNKLPRKRKISYHDEFDRKQLANRSATLANDRYILKKTEFTSFARIRAGEKIGAGQVSRYKLN
jgi:hypothetical protein